jgi:hypothetical protein
VPCDRLLLRSLVGRVTLDTQVSLAVKPGMFRIVAAFGGVTGLAGHHLAGSRIEDIFADGMGEPCAVEFLMALSADIDDGSLHHGRVIGSVGRMAVVAGIGQLMLELCLFAPLEGPGMTRAANMNLLPFEQPLIIAGMRRMAGHAAVVAVPNQMIVGRSHLFADIGMTPETGIDGHRFILAGVAVLAILRIGWVQDVPNHRRPVAAVRTVAGTALAQFGREVGMLLLHRGQRMTPQAQRIPVSDQKIGVVRLVRPMTGEALSLGVRRVGMLELFGQISVAVETERRGGILQQRCLIRPMRIVTAQTFPLFNRLMHHALALFLGRLGVTGVAQIFHLFLQQAFIAGDMGAVAGKAFAIGRRRVIHLFLEIFPVVTVKTDDGCLGDSLDRQQEAHCRSQDHYGSQRT